MNRELKYVKKWLHANKLALNIEKTNYVLCRSIVKKITEPIVLKFGRKKITRANHVKFLGVLLDKALAGNSTYLTEVSRKLSRYVGIFCKLRTFVPKEMLKTVYYSLFYPFLSIDIVVWGAYYEKYLKLVFISQKKPMRAITPCFWTFRYLSLKIYIVFTFLFLPMSVSTTLLHFILVIILLRSEFHQYNTRSASHDDLSLVRKIQCNMVYALSVLME